MGTLYVAGATRDNLHKTLEAEMKQQPHPFHIQKVSAGASGTTVAQAHCLWSAVLSCWHGVTVRPAAPLIPLPHI